MDINNLKTVNVFWTGGFDSTLRVLQLSQLNVEITPVYIKCNRVSENHELLAIKAITDIIRNHARTVGKLNPLKIINLDDIPEDNEVTRSFYKLSRLEGLGIQYEWLSRYAKYCGGGGRIKCRTA